MIQHRFCRDIHSKYKCGNIEVYLTKKIISAQQEEGSLVAPKASRDRGRGGKTEVEVEAAETESKVEAAETELETKVVGAEAEA